MFIPRPETEVLVQLAVQALPDNGRALDLCCGSGAVGVSLAAERPDSAVDLVELEQAPFETASRNAARHAAGRARVLRGDLFAPIVGPVRYDAIVANPPYIARADAGTLAKDIVDHEPHAALFGGDDGLDVMRRIVAAVPRFLNPGGFFGVEIDPPQAERVVELCEQAGLVAPRVVKDLAGLDRHVVARGQ